MFVEVALQYNDAYPENAHTFANSINTTEGARTPSGSRAAPTRTITATGAKLNLPAISTPRSRE